MKNNRTNVLVIFGVLAVVLATISIFSFVYTGTSSPANPSTTTSGTNSHYPNGMMGNSGSGMMSDVNDGSLNQSSTFQTATTNQNSVLSLTGFVALIGAALTGIGGGVYFLKVPKIIKSESTAISTVSSLSQGAVTPYESVSKTLTAEERTVLDILISHDGKYLQKYIRAETGLSRLKTHRIVNRLSDRGIVTLEKSGNTNEVYLSSWLNEKPFNKISSKQTIEQEILVKQ
jgi:uncharacterized membrane protein